MKFIFRSRGEGIGDHEAAIYSHGFMLGPGSAVYGPILCDPQDLVFSLETIPTERTIIKILIISLP